MAKPTHFSYTLTTQPTLFPEALPERLEYVTFTATADGRRKKIWLVSPGTLFVIFSQLVAPLQAAHIVGELRKGNTVQLPGTYTPTQLCEFGFRDTSRSLWLQHAHPWLESGL
jgi:hypothetical protein